MCGLRLSRQVGRWGRNSLVRSYSSNSRPLIRRKFHGLYLPPIELLHTGTPTGFDAVPRCIHRTFGIQKGALGGELVRRLAHTRMRLASYIADVSQLTTRPDWPENMQSSYTSLPLSASFGPVVTQSIELAELRSRLQIDSTLCCTPDKTLDPDLILFYGPSILFQFESLLDPLCTQPLKPFICAVLITQTY